MKLPGAFWAKTDAWINATRLRSYPLIFLVVFYGLWLFWIFSGTGMLDRRGTIIGSDFLTVYSGSIFAHTPDPGRAYELDPFMAVQNQVAGAEVKPLMWRYPPPAFLLVWPLSLLSYLPACFLWLILTGAAFFAVIYFVAPRRETLLLFLSFPGFYQNWVQGQNAMFTGALLCGGLVRAGTNPWQGGFLLGLLVYKPQYGALALLFLLFRKEWRALLTAIGTGAALILASLAVYGPKPWLDFHESLSVTLMVVENGLDPIHKLITFYGSLVLLGVPGDIARLIHEVFAFAVIVGCCVFWLRSKDRLASAALTVCGTLLITPYAYDYEFVILAFPLAWLIAHNLKAGWPVGEKTLCVLLWMAPFLVPPLAKVTHLQLGFLAPLILGFLVWRTTFPFQRPS